MSEKRKILEVRNLGIDFGGLTAVNNLDMDVYEGEIYGLIGPNGAGKTTVFNVISGVYQPTSGSVYFQNQNMAGKKPFEFANALNT